MRENCLFHFVRNKWFSQKMLCFHSGSRGTGHWRAHEHSSVVAGYVAGEAVCAHRHAQAVRQVCGYQRERGGKRAGEVDSACTVNMCVRVCACAFFSTHHSHKPQSPCSALGVT